MLLDLRKIFGRSKSSKDVAKERLKLVLIHDRANVSPQFLEMLKSEIIKVITNYMDVDESALEIQLTKTRSDDGQSVVPALYANIPIKNIRKSGK
ncbi:MAG: cell division topological specificity factor MinE [Clostridiaceae bacterium]|jgi:cell division topological specificity factor|nr:cell division topological specificity factor MinE [Clostridiaceae bacterium]